MVNRIKSLFESREGRDVFERVCSTVRRYGMAAMLEGGVLLGLSGGADSVFLAAYLYEYRRRVLPDMTVCAVHVNHGIRGAEADRDEHFSRELCEALDFGFEARGFDVPAIAKRDGMGLEEAARNVRYSVFDEIIRGRNNLSCIATAHNLTDNVETVIFNITRGAGARGAMGIAPVKGKLIRPIIDIGKKEIKQLLDGFGINYVCDSTNDSTEYSRNYIRHEILPRLERINPRFEEAYASFAAALREDDDFISHALSQLGESAKESSVDVELMRSLHPAEFARFISDFARHNGASAPDRRQIRALSGLVCGDNFRYSLGELDFVCERGRCRFASKDAPKKAPICQKLTFGENKIEGYCGVIHIGESLPESSLNVYKISIQADLSSAIISDSLYVRFRRDGDAYYYGCMTHKLKKVFNDRDIPPSHRDRIPVICDGDGIVWVPGLKVREDRTPVEGEKTFISFSIPKDGEGEELYTALKEVRQDFGKVWK